MLFEGTDKGVDVEPSHTDLENLTLTEGDGGNLE